jgi:hypothetical protein
MHLEVAGFVRTGVKQWQDEEEVEREADEVADCRLRDCPRRVTLRDTADADQELKGDDYILCH